MNENVEKCMLDLIEAIRDSEEYRAFETSKEKITEYPDLQRQVQEFRKQVFFLQNSDDSLDRMGEMARLFGARSELHRTQIMAEYLNSELRICRMLQRISMNIMNVTDIEIGSFEDTIPI